MVEWGPGGGANAVRFAREVGRLYGVDISEANLAECRRQLESQPFRGFIPILIDANQPQEALDRIAERVDFFLSTAVFQHFPSKEYGVKVTQIAYQMLKDNGIALIQTRYDDGSARLKPKDRDYARNAVTFTSYPIQEYWQIALECGFAPLAVVLDVGTRYAYYLLRRDAHV